MAETKVPDAIEARLLAIRARMIQDQAGAVAELEVLLRKSSNDVQRQIIKALDLSPSKQTAKVRSLLRRYHVADAALITASVTQGLHSSAELAAGYAGSMAQVHAEILGLANTVQPPVSGLSVSDQGAARLLAERSKRIVGPLPKPKTAGDRLAQENLNRFKGTGDVSAVLNGQAKQHATEATRVVMKGIKESKTVADSAQRMQAVIRLEGNTPEVPRLLKQLQEAGRKVARTGSPQAQKEWTKIIRRLDRYQETLRETGTTRKAYLALLQKVKSKKFRVESLDSTLERWTYQAQRGRAERWVRTESATAFRNLQFEQDKQRSWVVGYIWRMHRTTHKRWVNRGKRQSVRGPRRTVGGASRKKKFGGKHCICEALANSRLSVETAQQFPNGGHPHCNCTLVPIIDKGKMRDAPITAEEREFLGD